MRRLPSQLVCGLLVVTGTLSLAAQAPVPPPMARPQPPVPAPPGGDMPPITVTGCLKPWDHTAGPIPDDPPAGQAGAAMHGARFVLTDIEAVAAPDAARAQQPPGQPPPRPAPPSPAHPRASRFVVVAGSGVNLAAHVNHTVRITGLAEGLEPAEPNAPPAARPGDPPPAAAPDVPLAARDNAWSTLTASSVTLVRATCTTKS